MKDPNHGFGAAVLISLMLGSPARVVAEGPMMLGAPVYDTASETTHRIVDWSDFRGTRTRPPAGPGRRHIVSFAAIATHLELHPFDLVPRRDATGWLVEARAARTYAVMDKYHSSVVPGSRDDATLAHEQLHFDLAEAEARRLTLELRRLVGRGTTAEAAVNDLRQALRSAFESGVAGLQTLQARYDEESVHGNKEKAQARWAKDIAARLRDATDALSKAEEEPLAPAGRP